MNYIYFFFHVLEKKGEEEKEAIKSRSKPLKEKTTKAERRALQEAQRAAKGLLGFFVLITICFLPCTLIMTKFVTIID